MQEQERLEVLGHLRQAQTTLEGEVADVSPSQAQFRAGPQHWSILDCVEHLALTEASMLRLITDAARPAEATGEGRETKILKHITNRTRRVGAPAGLEPAGRFETVEEALRAFAANRGRTIEFVESLDNDLRGSRTIHPVMGDITCRECLALIMGHPLRHLEQIREIKSAAGYPA